jgi:hypothetical protein
MIDASLINLDVDCYYELSKRQWHNFEWYDQYGFFYILSDIQHTKNFTDYQLHIAKNLQLASLSKIFILE